MPSFEINSGLAAARPVPHPYECQGTNGHYQFAGITGGSIGSHRSSNNAATVPVARYDYPRCYNSQTLRRARVHGDDDDTRVLVPL